MYRGDGQAFMNVRLTKAKKIKTLDLIIFINLPFTTASSENRAEQLHCASVHTGHATQINIIITTEVRAWSKGRFGWLAVGSGLGITEWLRIDAR